MRIYTKTGDSGRTGILGKGRLRKDAPRIRALGALDELNSVLGLVLAAGSIPIRPELERVQNTLFEVGAAVANPDGSAANDLMEAETSWLESVIDRWEDTLPPLDRFILPGGTQAGALLHWARTVSRRAERDIVTAFAADPARAPMLRFMNRLSDSLFVLARAVNHEARCPETGWVPAKKKG